MMPPSASTLSPSQSSQQNTYSLSKVAAARAKLVARRRPAGGSAPRRAAASASRRCAIWRSAKTSIAARSRSRSPCFERREEVRGAQQVPARADVDRLTVRQRDHRQHALGRDAVAVEGLGEERGRDALAERRGAAAVGGGARAGAEEAPLFGGRGAQPGHTDAAARQVPGHTVVREGAVPDAAPVSRGGAAAARVLELQVAGRHVGVRQAVARGHARAVQVVPLVQDLQAEGREDRAWREPGSGAPDARRG